MAFHDSVNGATDIVPPPERGTWAYKLAAALADVTNALGTTKGGVTHAPLFEDAVELLAREFDGASWLVTGLLTRLGIATIGAEPKASKTWLGTEIAVAVATGTKVCGEFYAASGIVAYFYAEDLDKQVRNRIRALLAGADRKLAPGRLHVRPRGEFLDITRDADLAWIVASCRELGPIDLLVLDPLRDISSAAEDKSDEMSPVMRRLRLLAELLTCTVAIVHHMGKSGPDSSKRRPGQQLRGSGAIHGSTDSGIYLRDLKGNGSTQFINTLDSEVKGARSAGRLTLELNVEDDAQGEAVRATWRVSRESKKPKTAEQADDEAVLTFVRELANRGEYLTRTALREHEDKPAKVGVKRTTAALGRLIDTQRLIIDLDDGAVVRLGSAGSAVGDTTIRELKRDPRTGHLVAVDPPGSEGES
ncbi:MAG: AAA family ATPase [Proteobacteria bacterium]|nr:AAA family ATPase [Pseudomonadota bacterium]